MHEERDLLGIQGKDGGNLSHTLLGDFLLARKNLRKGRRTHVQRTCEGSEGVTGVLSNSPSQLLLKQSARREPSVGGRRSHGGGNTNDFDAMQQLNEQLFKMNGCLRAGPRSNARLSRC